MQLFFESHPTYEILPFMKFLIFTLLLTFAVHAQHSDQPQKESNSDLRSQSVIFSVEIVKEEKTFWLERTANMDYFLRKKEKGEETIKKLDGRVAKKLDLDFASRYLKCQYEISDVPGECKVTLRLSLKGETQSICQKDEKKSQEILSFISELTKRF